jgi:ADP-ribosylglycohydrolase
MPATYRGRNDKWFQENLGNGAMTISSLGRKDSKSDTSEKQNHLVPDSPPVPQEWLDQFDQEAREQWSGFDMDCIEAFKRGDRIGLPFEGGATFQPINEHLLEMALKSSQGSDESSIVDCFLKFVADYNYTTREQFVWDWVNYHQLHHGTGYGSTMKDHFNLVSYMRKHTEKYPDLDSRIYKLAEISKDADSFGNGSLALVYPAYFYGFVVGEEPAEFVRYITSFTHTNEDATKAVNLLMDIIEGKHVDAPTEEFIRKNCFAEHATAYNTLLTAMYIADAGTEMEVIRRAVWVGGDTDSTLATAMLLWKMKTNSAQKYRQFVMEEDFIMGSPVSDYELSEEDWKRKKATLEQKRQEIMMGTG